MSMRSDGKNLFIVNEATKEYEKAVAEPNWPTCSGLLKGSR